MDEETNFIATKYFWVILVLGLIFMMLIGYNTVKIYSGETCGKDTITDYKGKEYTNHSYILNSPNKALLQKFYIEQTEAAKYSFCYVVDYENSSGAYVQIIDEYNETLGVNYIINTTKTYCNVLDLLGRREAYLGIRCLDCSNDNIIYPQKEILGNETIQIEIALGSSQVTKDNALGYHVYAYKNCRDRIKSFYLWYIFTICALMLLLLVVLGKDKFKSYFIEGIFKK